MAAKIEFSTLAGWFKDRFGEASSALPSEGYDVLAKRIPFSEADRLGEQLSMPVRLQHSTGWTFAGGATSGTMFALNSPNSGLMKEATFTGQEFVIREQISWATMRRAQGSVQAFGNAFDEIVMDIKNNADLALEMGLIYGGSSFGTIESQTGASTSRVYTLTKASSSAGLWWKMPGALFDVYDTAGGTKQNTLADIVVVSTDLNDSTGKITVSVTGNATDLTAIDTTLLTSAVLIPKGGDGNMTRGIDFVASNTSTSYGGISPATYPLWRSTSLNASSAGATFSKFLHALKKNRLKSGAGKRTALISEATTMDIVDNLAALQRMVNKSKGKLELGGDSIEFHSPGGSIEFLTHVLCKEGEAFLLNLDKWKRIGSTEFTFDPTGKEEYFEPVAGFAGNELLGYWDQGAVCTAPNTITKITGIVNTY